MNRWIGKIMLGVGLLLSAALITPVVEADPPPPTPEQQRPDIFPLDPIYVQKDMDGDGDRDMQDLNPTNIKSKRERTTSYRLVTMSGCTAGDIPDWLAGPVTNELKRVDYDLVRNDRTYDYTIFISCGLTHVSKCGSVGVFCLADGFPYNTNIYLSDVLKTYTPGSKLSIPLHELLHAIATWNEQYQACGATCGFLPTPNLIDFMNTGANSRVGFTDVTLARWERTMYELVENPWGPCDPRWGNCWLEVPGWVFPDGGVCVPDVGCFPRPIAQ